MSEKNEETVYLTSANTRRSIHKTPDCKTLGRAQGLVEKPASVFPEGFHNECSECYGDDE